MTRLLNRIPWQSLLVAAGLTVALPLILVGCSGGDSSPPSQPAPISQTATPTEVPAPSLATPTEVSSPSAATPAAAPPSSATVAPEPTPVPTQRPMVEDENRTLTVYSGRSQTLVHPLLQAFGEYTGVDIKVKYGGSASMAATILEEGDNTPADVVFLQDPGSLGALSAAGMLDQIPQESLDKVDPRFRARGGEWIGTSGRARTIIYNTEAIDPAADLPPSILDFTEEEWKGRVGWAPRNGSFQAFVTSLRLQLGEEQARRWLEGMKENDARDYPNNVSIVAAAAQGEVEVGFVNHYYLERFLEEQGQDFGARNHYLGKGDPGALVLVAGVGILRASEDKETAREFVEFLLSEPAQVYFTSEIKEYPVSAGVAPVGDLPPLETLDPPDVDLGSLSDLEGTIDLLRDAGVLP